MPLLTKRFLKLLTASRTLFLAAQTAWADSLTDIYQAALQMTLFYALHEPT